MGAGADDEHLPPPLLSAGDDLVYAGHIGAGGVDDRPAQARQRLMDGPSLPVGTDKHRHPRRNLLRGVHQAHPYGLQIGDHVPVVDDGPQHDAWPALLRRHLRHLHRPADSVAEAGGAGQLQPHRPA